MKSQEMPRAVRIGFELLAEANHMGVYSARVGERFVAPDGVENHIARKRAVGVLQEEREQVVFGGREADFLVASRDHAAVEIHLHVAEREDFLLAARLAAQHGADARQQLAGTEGLNDVVIGADFEQKNFIDLLADRAEHDDGPS